MILQQINDNYKLPSLPGRGDARRVDREVGELEDSPVEDCGTMRNMWDEVDRGGNISGLQVRKCCKE